MTQRLTDAQLAEIEAAIAFDDGPGPSRRFAEGCMRYANMLLAEVKALREQPAHWANAHDERVRQIDALKEELAEAAADERAAIIKRLTEKPFETLDQVVAWIDKRGEPESGEAKT